MKYLYVGKYVTTHGIKGEIKIRSDISFKKEAFKIGQNLYLGKEKTKFVVKSYRIHKNYDMITFNEISNINEILPYKNYNVYINEEDLTNFVQEQLIGYSFYEEDKYIGTITDVINGINPLLEIDKKILVPNVEANIIKIDSNEKKLFYKKIVGLIS